MNWPAEYECYTYSPSIHPLDLKESPVISVHLVRIKLVDDVQLVELLNP